MSIYVFRRKEQKYLLTQAQRTALEDVLKLRMQPDRYGKSLVCNIYYDTPDYRLIRRSLEKPSVYKEKIRLRGYGTITPESQVFLEMKKKYKGVVYKRRISLQEQSAVSYMADVQATLDAGQIGRELDYFKQFYGSLRPAVYLSYERFAWHDPHGSDLRITMDQHILHRWDDLTLTVPPSGKDLLEPGQSLLEIKTAGGMPLWLTEVLTANQIRPTSFSKYGMAYTQLIKTKVKETENGGIQYA